MVDQVKVDPALLDYVMEVVQRTRTSDYLSLGVSPRGAIAWYRAAQAYALTHGRDYCIPDDFKHLAIGGLAVAGAAALSFAAFYFAHEELDNILRALGSLQRQSSRA